MKTRERIPLAQITDNPWQPRQEIDREDLRELVESIRHLDVLQAPLGRRTEDGRVQLAFGHRRVEGCRVLHEEGSRDASVDMDIAELTDEEMAVMGLTENEARKQLSQIEVVRAHKRAIDETELTAAELAARLGIAPSTLSNHLRVLELPPVALERVESGALKLAVARNLLVLKGADGHIHEKDLGLIIKDISSVEGWRGSPDWRQSNVRRKLYERVSYNEDDFRPLGPRGKSFMSGGHREAGFDVDAFAKEFADSLHTIPGGGDNDESRLWTCAVKPWRSWQSRATREANKEAEAKGKPKPASSSKNPSRDQQLQKTLAADPVMKKVVVSREKSEAKPGPARPLDDAEKKQLGTRAEMVDVGYGMFWKVVQKANGDTPAYSWNRNGDSGGLMPPYMPDMKECNSCVSGAAYGKSRTGYPPSEIRLICVNQKCYMAKVSRGKAEYGEKVEAQRKGEDRQDEETYKDLVRALQPLSNEARKALATGLLASTSGMATQDPLGAFDNDFSYENLGAAKARQFLGLKGNGKGYDPEAALAALDDGKVAPGDLRGLAAALVVHHLRVSGRTEWGNLARLDKAESNGTNPDQGAEVVDSMLELTPELLSALMPTFEALKAKVDPATGLTPAINLNSLAEELSISRATLKRRCANLKAAGWIEDAGAVDGTRGERCYRVLEAAPTAA